MTSPAAIQADYCDLRFIKSRKVCQIVVEIPIEAGGAFVAAFGTPDPSKGVPIALARIDPDAKSERKGGPLARRAGIISNEGAFKTFMAVEKHASGDPAVFIRYHCNVESRADIDHDEAAAALFLDLEREYKAWLTVPA